MAHTMSLYLMPLILCVYGSALDTVCLDYYACYKDQYIDWNYVNLTLESLHEERSAVTCTVECLHRSPDTQFVLVKLVGVDELLDCGCGSELSLLLGNESKIAQDRYDCYVCPDVDNQKCGSDKAFSVYRVHHDADDDPSCGGGLYIDLKTTTSTTITNIIPTSTPNSNNRHNPHNSTSFPVGNTTATATMTPDSLRFLGCYDEERVNESQVLTLYLEGVGVGVLDCYQNCFRLHPATPDLMILVKLLKADRLYCGCSGSAAVGPEALASNCDLYCYDNLAEQQCGGWNSVSAYAGNQRHTLSFGLLLINLLLLVQDKYMQYQHQL